jgi:hypothetical protein
MDRKVQLLEKAKGRCASKQKRNLGYGQAAEDKEELTVGS